MTGRGLYLFLALAGCGRIDFAGQRQDATTATPDVTGDARPIDCTVLADGTACDDRNICTPSSTCQAGQCVPTTPMASCTVADSELEFATSQGDGGWFYGFWEAEADASYEPSTDFQLGVYDGTFSWIPTSGGMYIYMASWGAHARFGPLRIPVRRWVSDVQGPAVAHVHFDKSDTSCGDGVELHLVVDGADVWNRAIVFDDATGITDAVPIDLSAGTLVEIQLQPRTNDACDTSNTTLTITSP